MIYQLMKIVKCNSRIIPSTFKLKHAYYSKIYEPDYLGLDKSPIPEYTAINIKISGYDYPILEKYQKFIHRMSEVINLDVENGFALPSKKLHIQNYKPRSNITETEYNLSIYQRNIQINDPPSTLVSILLKIIESSAPEGVEIEVQPFSPLLEQERYIPNKNLDDLKTQLETFGGPSKKK